MSATATLTVLFGLPGSGKSTWCSQRHITAHVLTLDDIRLRGEDPDTVGERVRRQAEELLQRGESVCIDACSLIAAHRRQWLSRAARYGVAAEIVGFRTDLATCQRRDAARPPAERANIDWEAAARNFDAALKAIPGEGWDRITWADGTAPAREDSFMRGFNPAATLGATSTPARVFRTDRFAGLTPLRSAPGRYTATAGRTGVLRYAHGDEHVPPEVLFELPSMKSLEGAPVTVNHPPSGTASRRDAVGKVLRAWQEGSRLRVELQIDAGWVITAIERGELKELSLGYQAEIVTDEFGRKTQGMRVYNHLALLAPGDARCGPECRIDGNNVPMRQACRCGGKCGGSMSNERYDDRDYAMTPDNVRRLMNEESARQRALHEERADAYDRDDHDLALTPENVRRLSREGA